MVVGDLAVEVIVNGFQSFGFDLTGSVKDLTSGLVIHPGGGIADIFLFNIFDEVLGRSGFGAFDGLGYFFD